LAISALLLWLASKRLQLWPESLDVPRPSMLWLGIGMYVPYALLRAKRLGYALDPLVRDASQGRMRRLPPSLLFGSGFVAFFVVILLPFRLGELARPILLARGKQPGVGVTESLTGIASERIIDGLVVCGMLFAGLSFAGGLDSQAAGSLETVRHSGRVMLVLFAVGLVVLLVAARHPEPASRIARVFVGRKLGQRVEDIARRFAGAIRALLVAGRGVPFLLISVAYWGVTVVQLWLVLFACGIDLGPAEACAIVAIVALSIQVPGGPAQVGQFQVGMTVALSLFLAEAAVQGAGSSFAFVMYFLQLGGAAAAAGVGALLLSMARPQAGQKAP
jgi:uncharacterized membrane protein YbhN (UPF0104 family)